MVKIGYLYVFQEANNPYFKIGVTKNDVEIRGKSLQTGNPRPLRLIRKYRVKNHYQLETIVHNQLAQYHMKGGGKEWYNTNKLIVINVIESNINRSNGIMLERIADTIGILWVFMLVIVIVTIILDLLVFHGAILTYMINLVV